MIAYNMKNRDKCFIYKSLITGCDTLCVVAKQIPGIFRGHVISTNGHIYTWNEVDILTLGLNDVLFSLQDGVMIGYLVSTCDSYYYDLKTTETDAKVSLLKIIEKDLNKI